MTAFFNRIEEERETKGMTAIAFGAVGGVGRAAQYNYEKGERKPDIDYLANIAKIGCDIQYIVTGVRSTQALTDDVQELVGLYLKADISKKAAMIAVARSGEESRQGNVTGDNNIVGNNNISVGSVIRGSGNKINVDMNKKNGKK